MVDLLFSLELRLTNPASSTEGFARFENARRAVRLSARLTEIAFDDLTTPTSAVEELIGRRVGEHFMLIPLFSTDCGLNTTVGKWAFINQGCHFMDMGGLTIGDDVMIGPKVTIVTAGHPVLPSERRNDVTQAPIVIANNV